MANFSHSYIYINFDRSGTRDTVPFTGLVSEYHAAMNSTLKDMGYDDCAFGTAGSYARKGYSVLDAVRTVINLRNM